MLKMFISSNPRIPEVGGYKGSPTDLQYPLMCSFVGSYFRILGVPHL